MIKSFLRQFNKEKNTFFKQYAHCADDNVLEEIWKAKIEEKISLNCYLDYIIDLSPFQELTNLQELVVGRGIISDLSSLKNLVNLKRLFVQSVLVRDLNPLKDLINLQELDVRTAKFSDLSPLKNLVNLKQLNISSTDVSDLRPLKDLANLSLLYIARTEVSDLSPLKDLVNLKQLNISNTAVSDLSPLKNLSNLQDLDVSDTQVSDLKHLEHLTNLQKLDISLTKVIDLSPLKKLFEKGIYVVEDKKEYFRDTPKGINTRYTSISNPPIEIAKQGNEAILRYWEEQERTGTYTLNTARLLIVGQAGAGKTSLRTKLMNAQADLPTVDETTRGIDIEIMPFDTDRGQFDLLIWDFGGQNIQHYAHQFFLSDSVVYALVRDERKEDGGMSYWLNIIHLLGKDSPVIIVQNEKQGHSEDIKELAAIRKAFPKVQEPIKINLKRAGEADYRPFQDLRREICHQATKLPHVGRGYAASYKLLQDDLQTMGQEKQYIRLQEYEDVCKKQGMTNRDTMYDFLRSYHQLGVSLWFEQDIDLENFVFLRPKWIIDALFELLYDSNKRRQEAIIDTKAVRQIWRGDEYRGMHGTLLKLMRNFEMCYELKENESYLIPQNQPPCPIEIKESLTATKVLFEYEFLPKGFLTRLICRQHHRILDQQVWNNAVIFGEKDSATVLAYETYEQNKIELIAEGTGKAQLLNETINQLDTILKDSKFRNLQVKKLVPCPCRVCKSKEKPYYFDYAYLQGKILRGSKRVECQNLFDDVLIRDILKEISIFSIAQIKEYLAADKIEEALKLLRGQFEDDKEIILITMQLNEAYRKFLSDLISREEYQIVKNKKVLLILEMLKG